MFSARHFEAAATASRRPGSRAPALAAACAAAALLACSGLATAAWGAQATFGEGVAAIVNDEIISTYDVRQRTLLLVVTSGVQVTDATLPAITREALRQLVDERLQMQEVKRIQDRTKMVLEPSKEELDEQVERLAQQNNLTSEQMLAQLGAAGVDRGALLAQIHTEISWQRYVGGRFGQTVKVGDDQIASALKRAEASSAKAQYQVAEIFIDAQRAGGQQQAMEGAQQLVSQIQGGAPFAGVARQFSAAPSATAGGDAGWMIAGDMAPALEQALEQMRPGQLSQPISVNGGAYILMLRDKRAGAGANLVSLKQAAVRLSADAPAGEVEAARAKLETLRGQIASCDQMEAQVGKTEGVVAGDLGEADINDLSAAFRDAIAPLQIGQVSAPVRTNAGLHLVALCGKRAGGANQLTRDEIESRLTEQELVMIARRELRNLRNSASIENK